MRTGVHQAFVSQIQAASHTLPFVNLHLVCWFQSSYKAKISALETKCKRLDVIQTSKRSVSETKHDSKRLNSTGVVKNERGSNQIATRPKPSSFSLYCHCHRLLFCPVWLTKRLEQVQFQQSTSRYWALSETPHITKAFWPTGMKIMSSLFHLRRWKVRLQKKRKNIFRMVT